MHFFNPTIPKLYPLEKKSFFPVQYYVHLRLGIVVAATAAAKEEEKVVSLHRLELLLRSILFHWSIPDQDAQKRGEERGAGFKKKKKKGKITRQLPPSLSLFLPLVQWWRYTSKISMMLVSTCLSLEIHTIELRHTRLKVRAKHQTFLQGSTEMLIWRYLSRCVAKKELFIFFTKDS